MLTALGTSLFDQQSHLQLPKAQLKVDKQISTVYDSNYYRLMQTGRRFRLGAQIIQKLPVTQMSKEILGNVNSFEFKNFYIQNKYATLSKEEYSQRNSVLQFLESAMIRTEYLNQFPNFRYRNKPKEVLKIFQINEHHYGQIKDLEDDSFIRYKSAECKEVKFDQYHPEIYVEVERQYNNIIQKLNLNREELYPLVMPVYRRVDILRETLLTIEKAQGIEQTIIIISQDDSYANVTNVIKEFQSRGILNIIHVFHPDPKIPLPFQENKILTREFKCASNAFFLLNLTFDFLKAKSVL